MERDNVQLVDDNCSQIEVAFKRMKVGTSRCVGKKSHPHIYHQPNHHYQPQQQLQSHPDHHLQQPNQLAQHPDQPSPNSTTVNPYYNQMFNTRVTPKSTDDETVDRLSSMNKSETLSFSSFSTSPLALKASLSCSNTVSSPNLAVNPVVISSNSMGPYRDVTQGQIDNLYHNNSQNQNNNNNNHNLNQSNDNTKYEDGPPADPDVSVEELAAYLDVQLYIPRKMSYMAELMYT